MKKLFLTFLFLLTLNIFSFADCPGFYPASWSPFSITSVQHFDANSYANYYPNLGIGSRITIKGNFPGITQEYFLVGQSPVYQSQGVKVFVDCVQASLNGLSSSQIEFVAPPGITEGTHTIYVFKNTVGSGYVYSANKVFSRWVPGMWFEPSNQYYSENTVTGLIFALNLGTNQVRFVAPIQAGIPLSTGIQYNEAIILQLNNVAGAYLGGASYTMSVNFSSAGNNYGAPYAFLGDVGGGYFRGGSFVTIQIPSTVRSLGGIWSMTFTVNGATTGLAAQLYI